MQLAYQVQWELSLQSMREKRLERDIKDYQVFELVAKEALKAVYCTAFDYYQDRLLVFIMFTLSSPGSIYQLISFE